MVFPVSSTPCNSPGLCWERLGCDSSNRPIVDKVKIPANRTTSVVQVAGCYAYISRGNGLGSAAMLLQDAQRQPAYVASPLGLKILPSQWTPKKGAVRVTKPIAITDACFAPTWPGNNIPFSQTPPPWALLDEGTRSALGQYSRMCRSHWLTTRMHNDHPLRRARHHWRMCKLKETPAGILVRRALPETPPYPCFSSISACPATASAFL